MFGHFIHTLLLYNYNYYVIMNNNVYFLQTIQHFGGIDILVSNAAANPSFGPILQVLAIGFYLLKYYIIIIIIHNKAITS